ncbi:MAG: hypothetical protein CL846_02550 [Crocinitomicaceae bacterium]|nr:hypothetical protein [Crocinitomicaceae bacterium]
MINKYTLFLISLLFFNYLYSQETQEFTNSTFEKNNEYSYSLGNGILFNFDDSTHLFKIGGMAQPSFLNSRFDDTTQNSKNYFGVKRAYFNVSGSLNNGEISFLIQTDFSDPYPLLDAWAGYHPTKNISIYFGQKQSPFNNHSMQMMEYNLQFASRNNLSKVFCKTGREFGLFIETRYSLGSIGLKTFAAITSGDGKNSFGVLSNDTDKGGLKYGARMNLYPFGFFSNGNELIGHDITKESKPKLMFGAASSLNIGASHSVGEGHYLEPDPGFDPPRETFVFYDSTGLNMFPNYLKNYVDLLFKYKGFNFLAEYVNTAAYQLHGSSLNSAGTDLLEPTQISNYLVLGNAYNIQAGYLFNSDWSIDLKWGQSYKEFSNDNSLLLNYDSMGAGFSKYFSNKAVKTQLMATYYNFPNSSDLNQLNLECVFQLKF